MAARAMWKGIVCFGDVRVPVKLYAAVQDRSVHFRLLHEKDHAPVRQAMVNPETDEEVPYDDTRRAYVSETRDLVVLDEEDLETVEPEASREIRILQFVAPSLIDHRWYRRPYYLGPDDGAEEAWRALAAALARQELEGLARWTMRRKEYVGALRLHAGCPMLVSLRHAEEIVSLAGLDVPAGRDLDERELAMARQLVDMLAANFEPEAWQDEYRQRVEQLIATKASGGKVKSMPRRQARRSEDLTAALQASLKQERKRA